MYKHFATAVPERVMINIDLSLHLSPLIWKLRIKSFDKRVIFFLWSLVTQAFAGKDLEF